MSLTPDALAMLGLYSNPESVTLSPGRSSPPPPTATRMLLESQGVPKSELMSLSELTAALAGRASDRREKPQEWKWLDVGDDVRIAVAPFGTSRVVVVLQKGTIMPVIGEQLSLHEARWIGLRMVEAALMVAEYGHQ